VGAAEPKTRLEHQKQNPMVSGFIECSDLGSANQTKLIAVVHDANGSVVHPNLSIVCAGVRGQRNVLQANPTLRLQFLEKTTYGLGTYHESILKIF
jgi:hypothetical protein